LAKSIYSETKKIYIKINTKKKNQPNQQLEIRKKNKTQN